MARHDAGRYYETTHPWITFECDLARLSPQTWMLLGETVSKCEHIAGVPLKPAVGRDLMKMSVTKGVHGTTSIEGNTLSEAEVQQRVDQDLQLPKSREYLGVEIDNIVGLYNDVMQEIVSQGGALPVSVARLKTQHARLLNGQPLKNDVVPGEIRQDSVGVGAYRGAPAEDCEYLMERLCRWINEGFEAPAGSEDLQSALYIIRAILAHLYFVWIHPFGDGNGRIARLLEFELLIRAGLPVPAAHVLSSHYNNTRDAYYAVLERTSRDPSYPVELFLRYALQGLADGLREQLDRIRMFQRDVTWENYVHEVFRDQDTPARRRQKHIALDLSPTDWTPRNRVRSISDRVGDEYAGRGPKTLTRDLNALRQLGLVVTGSRGVRPRREIVEAFLPPRATES